MLGVQDHAGRRSLALELLKRARQHKLAGVTVLEGVTGFGASGTLHETHLFRDDAPLSFVVVDAPERIDAFVARTEDLLADVVVLVDDVTILQGHRP